MDDRTHYACNCGRVAESTPTDQGPALDARCRHCGGLAERYLPDE